MKMEKLIVPVTAALLSTMAFPLTARGQSADALIDKLVEKGILTVKEANDLREEADKNFTSAYQVKSGLPDWVTSLKWSGDLRGRYEGFYASNPAAVDRNRFQYRLRAGLTVSMFDNLELGVRLASAGDTSGNPISSNQTLDNNANKKGLALDLAYGKWARSTPHWDLAATVGKLENPWAFTPIVFDPDYTPEGLSQQLSYHLSSEHDLKLNLGEFILEERGTSSFDTYLVGAQLLFDSKWNEHWQSSVGFGALAISGTRSLTVANGQLNIGEGNTRIGGSSTNAPQYHFNPIIASGNVTYTLDEFPGYSGPFPIKVAAEYLNNPAVSSDNEGYSAKLTFGKAGKRRQWEVTYEYRELQADAIYEEFPESDFNAFTQTPLMSGGIGGFVNGTNIRGHIVRLSYSLFDPLTLAITYWITENIRENPVGSESDASRLQIDAVWKF